MADSVTFHFDPTCPWTWLTSRWMVVVADETGLEVRWRPYSLPLLHEDDELPEGAQARADVSTRANRVVAHLADADRDDDIAAFYTVLGTALHQDGVEPTPDLVDDSLRRAGLDDADRLAEVADDPSLDPAVRETFERVIEQVGDSLGSPLLITSDGNTVFGPVLSPVPQGAEAVAAWEAVRTLADLASFHELKRGRSRPDLDDVPGTARP